MLKIYRADGAVTTSLTTSWSPTPRPTRRRRWTLRLITGDGKRVIGCVVKHARVTTGASCGEQLCDAGPGQRCRDPSMKPRGDCGRRAVEGSNACRLVACSAAITEPAAATSIVAHPLLPIVDAYACRLVNIPARRNGVNLSDATHRPRTWSPSGCHWYIDTTTT